MKRTFLLTLLILTAGGGHESKAGLSWQFGAENSIGMRFIDVAVGERIESLSEEARLAAISAFPPGSIMKPADFFMGQAEGGEWDERPAHKVAFSRPFEISVTEVTNSQYEQFDPDHKKPIPGLPHRVAVVTSPTGAAIRDILRVIGRRFPPANIVLFPVKVQGEGAAEKIAAAIRDAVETEST